MRPEDIQVVLEPKSAPVVIDPMELLTVKQVCAMWNISRTTLYKLMKEGLPVVPITDFGVRFRRQSLQTWMELRETTRNAPRVPDKQTSIIVDNGDRYAVGRVHGRG